MKLLPIFTRFLILLLSLVTGVGWISGTETGDRGSLRKTFRKYWQADTPKERIKQVKKILKSGVNFNQIWEELKNGRTYPFKVEKGKFIDSRMGDFRIRFPYTVLVPKSYSPEKKYPVRFYLHGGVTRGAWDLTGKWWASYEGFKNQEYISVFPAGWKDATWWYYNQAKNISSILDKIKSSYNIDENRAYLFGFSDGGTGVYFLALRDSTPWAAFFPFISNIKVLANQTLSIDQQNYPVNLAERPLFAVTGDKDQIYPTTSFLAYFELLLKFGVKVFFRPQEESGHDTKWYASEKNNIAQFMKNNIRDPFPDTLNWETNTTEKYNRYFWIIIDELGRSNQDFNFKDLNKLYIPPLGIGIDENVKDKVIVNKVYRYTIADLAGIRSGDEIVTVNGRRVPDYFGFHQALFSPKSQPKNFLKIKRSNNLLTIQFKKPEFNHQSKGSPAFVYFKKSGRIKVEKKGNRVSIFSKGIKSFTLLLSPVHFDFKLPVEVRVNGNLKFDKKVTKDPETLLKWAANDNDRTMLFGYELKILL